MASHLASRTMACTKRPAEGRRFPFLSHRGTCLYPAWERKTSEKWVRTKKPLCGVRTGPPVFHQRPFIKWEDRARLCRLPTDSPIFRLLNGRVYWPTKSLPDVESWSSMTKRTSASSGTYTSNWKVSFHDGLKPQKGEKSWLDVAKRAQLQPKWRSF